MWCIFCFRGAFSRSVVHLAGAWCKSNDCTYSEFFYDFSNSHIIWFIAPSSVCASLPVFLACWPLCSSPAILPYPVVPRGSPILRLSRWLATRFSLALSTRRRVSAAVHPRFVPAFKVLFVHFIANKYSTFVR